MGKLTINETREMFVTKCIVLGNKALDALMDDMNDPVKLAAITPKDLATMAKAVTAKGRPRPASVTFSF
jgi:hypothetical protein